VPTDESATPIDGPRRRGAVRRRARCALLGLALAALGGCGGVDGIELNGKVFDWLGVSPAALEKSKHEPQLAARAPLVLPPDANVNRLPEPGSEQPQDRIVGLDDPDQRKLAEAKERERLHLAYCRGEMKWKDTALNPQNVNAPSSPYGPCGIFGGVTSTLTKN
jgi:hypothetical protein